MPDWRPADPGEGNFLFFVTNLLVFWELTGHGSLRWYIYHPTPSVWGQDHTYHALASLCT